MGSVPCDDWFCSVCVCVCVQDDNWLVRSSCSSLSLKCWEACSCSSSMLCRLPPPGLEPLMMKNVSGAFGSTFSLLCTWNSPAPPVLAVGVFLGVFAPLDCQGDTQKRVKDKRGVVLVQCVCDGKNGAAG